MPIALHFVWIVNAYEHEHDPSETLTFTDEPQHFAYTTGTSMPFGIHRL